MQTGYKYAKQNPLVPLTDYPYTSGTTEKAGTCTYDSVSDKAVVSANGYSYVSQDNVTALKNAVQQQPVSISIDASSTYYNYYNGGILTNA